MKKIIISTMIMVLLSITIVFANVHSGNIITDDELNNVCFYSFMNILHSNSTYENINSSKDILSYCGCRDCEIKNTSNEMDILEDIEVFKKDIDIKHNNSISRSKGNKNAKTTKSYGEVCTSVLSCGNSLICRPGYKNTKKTCCSYDECSDNNGCVLPGTVKEDKVCSAGKWKNYFAKGRSLIPYTMDYSNDNWAKVKLFVDNNGGEPVGDFVAYYYLEASDDSSVDLGDWSSYGAKLSIEQIKDEMYKVKIDFTGTMLSQGNRIPRWDGINFGVSHKIGSYWNATNDYSYLDTKGRFRENPNVVIYDSNGNLIYGKVPSFDMGDDELVINESTNECELRGLETCVEEPVNETKEDDPVICQLGANNTRVCSDDDLEEQNCDDLSCYTSLSDQEIFDMAIEGSDGIFGCWIQDRIGKSGFCDYYVKSSNPGVDEGYGWPKHPVTNGGTGCVYAPNAPKHRTLCGTGYAELGMCTDDHVHNAAEAIRHALNNGACTYEEIIIENETCVCDPNVRSCECQGSKTNEFLELSDAALFKAALNASVGGCWIQDRVGKTGVCDYYVKSAINGSDDYFGWPKHPVTNGGTGCVYSPNSPKSVYFCGTGHRDMGLCSDDHIFNAAEALRDALRNNACGLES